uniref:Ribosome binding factor A n=1 Tax=Lepisosteus oculatus TaxID=7918 RepID=W5MPB1_LEPOC
MACRVCSLQVATELFFLVVEDVIMYGSRTTLCFSKFLTNQNYFSCAVAKCIAITNPPSRYYSPELRSSPGETVLCIRNVNISSFRVIFERTIGTSSIHYGSKNLLKKFAKKTKKKFWYESPILVSKPIHKPSTSQDAVKFTPPPKTRREDSIRMRALNSILYRAISDLLSSNEVSSEICELSLEISKVSLPLDFSCCRVYWKTSGISKTDDLIQQVLDRSAPRVRYLLIAHQVLGSVPPVTFIKDKEYAAVLEVERLLKMADFGPNENTEEPEQILTDGREPVCLISPSEQPATPKPSAVFGIDHEALNRQIMAYKQKPKEALTETAQFGLTEQQQDMLAELRKQKEIRRKKKKNAKRYRDDDITPQAYLLERYGQRVGREEESGYREYSAEDWEIKELMAEEDQKNRS